MITMMTMMMMLMMMLMTTLLRAAPPRCSRKLLPAHSSQILELQRPPLPASRGGKGSRTGRHSASTPTTRATRC